jgi:transposase-like protein
MPKSAHPGAKKALAEIWNAEDKTHALAAVKAFEAAYGAKFAKAVTKVTDDIDTLLAFYDFPALRHEAPYYRAEVKDLRRWAVAAA